MVADLTPADYSSQDDIRKSQSAHKRNLVRKCSKTALTNGTNGCASHDIIVKFVISKRRYENEIIENSDKVKPQAERFFSDAVFKHTSNLLQIKKKR
ncbi:hypothetical protein [Dryocola clanedunensis]|uniref:hypothetical protein n=1 Tax=Cedecea sulfonylureivorans TaxID=3051154 RepID=UPI001928ECE7|nr:hypothetical protein [Cedecea sulfonylureivorans]